MHEEPHEQQPELHTTPALQEGAIVAAIEPTETTEGEDRANPDASDPVATPARKPRVIALLNQKGGVGKTTSTVNLGAAFARYGQRVLLVDLDPQSNLSLHFGVESGPEQRTIRDLLLDPTCQIQDAVQTARPGLDFIPAVTELALVEGELAQQEGMQTVLRSKLESVYGNYDVVLLDCPPSLGVLSVNALTVADEVFVPMQAHYLPLRGLEKLLQTVHLISQGLNPTIRVTGILLCMHDGSSSHARAVIGEIKSQLAQFRGADVPWSNAMVLDPPVRRNIKLAEAPSFGQTIFDYAPHCPGADDYRRIAEQLLIGWGLPHSAFEGAGRAQSNDASETQPKRRRKMSKSGKATKRAAPVASKKSVKAKKFNAPSKTTKVAKVAKAGKVGKSAKPSKSAKPTKSAKPSKSAKPTPSKKFTSTKSTSKKSTAPAKTLKTRKTAKPSKPAKPSKFAKLTKPTKPTKRTKSARRPLRSGGLSL
jgi:chromosome partitioning protein